MDQGEAKEYLGTHRDYSYALKSINIGLKFEMGYSREAALRKIPQREAQGSYTFIQSAIDKLQDDGTFVLMVMNPYHLEALQAYLVWSHKTDPAIPIYRNKDGNWLDQYGHPIEEDKLPQWAGYADVVNSISEYAAKVGISDAGAFEDVQSTYCAWFMQSARYQKGISNDMFYSDAVSMEDSEFILKKYWSPDDLIDDFENLADRYYWQYIDKCAEIVKDTPGWCEYCYGTFCYIEQYHQGSTGNTYWRGELVGTIDQDGHCCCSRGHSCGYTNMETSELLHTGDFSKVLLAEMNK